MNIYYLVEKNNTSGNKTLVPEYMLTFIPNQTFTIEEQTRHVKQHLERQKQRRRRYNNFQPGKFICIITKQEFIEMGGEFPDLSPKVK